MASKWSFICNTKRLRQCKHLILKTTAAALSLCRTKTRFPSSLMVSASFIFKRDKTRLRTWGTVCAVRERDDSKREQEWDSRRMSGARVLREAQEPLRWLRLSPYSCKLTPSLSKAKHSLEKSGGRRGRRGGSFYFFFLMPIFTLMLKISHHPLATHHL